MHLENKEFYSSFYTGFFMAAISGFSDVFGFIALDQLFTAHITGNIVIVIAFIISSTKGIVSKALAIPLFILFASIISTVIETHGLTKKSLSFWLFFEVVLFILLLCFGILFIPSLSVTSFEFIAISMLPVCAMAIHNTLLRTYMRKLPPCTVMTGNLTQIIVDVTAYLISPFMKTIQKRETALSDMKPIANVLGGFVCGGLLSAFGYVWLGFWAIIFIVSLLLILITLLIKEKQ